MIEKYKLIEILIAEPKCSAPLTLKPFLSTSHTTCLLQSHLNVSVPSLPQSSKFLFATPKFCSVHIPCLPFLVTCPVPCNRLDFTIQAILDNLYKVQNSSLCNVQNCSLTSSFLDPIIFLSTLFWNICY